MNFRRRYVSYLFVKIALPFPVAGGGVPAQVSREQPTRYPVAEEGRSGSDHRYHGVIVYARRAIRGARARRVRSPAASCNSRRLRSGGSGGGGGGRSRRGPLHRARLAPLIIPLFWLQLVVNIGVSATSMHPHSAE